jgi:hypothetical protein
VFQLGLDALGDESPERRRRIQELDALYAWWEERLPALREQYLAERRRARAKGAR